METNKKLSLKTQAIIFFIILVTAMVLESIIDKIL